MADYKNCPCIACRNPLEPEDDVVVCPECGTPYHRDCWNAYGHCINTELHEKGEAWTPPVSDADRIRCANCGSENTPNSLFCSHCGTSLRQQAQQSGMGAQGEGASGWRQHIPNINLRMEEETADAPETDLGGITMQEAADFVGKNVHYYLPRFRYFHQRGGKIAPNFLCLIFPEFYFAYRKMWLAAVLTLLASVLFSVPDTILSMVSQSDSFLATVQKQFGAASPTYLLIAQRFGNFVDFVQAHSVLWQRLDFIGSYLTLALHLLMCLFANRLYFHHVRRKVAFLRNDTTSLIDVRSRIRMAGGGSYGFVALFIGAQILVTGLLYMAWLMCF